MVEEGWGQYMICASGGLGASKSSNEPPSSRKGGIHRGGFAYRSTISPRSFSILTAGIEELTKIGFESSLRGVERS